MTETSARFGFVRSSAVVTIGGVILIGLAVVGAYTLLRGSSPPAERHNPSFLYGEKVMRRQIYGGYVGGPASIAGQCRYRITDAKVGPSDLNLAEAIAGCRYEEWALDN